MRTTAALIVGCVAAGCGSAAPPVDPAVAFLRVGVDPHEEARAVEASLAEGGFRVRTRSEGATFVALGLEHEARGETAVRVLTRRGIGLAIDVPGEQSAQPVGVVMSGSDGADLDGDGLEEVVLFRLDPVRERRCLAVVRVSDEGFVVPVPARLEGLGEQPCIEDLRDVGGDGRPEALVGWRLDELARGVVPRVMVPFAWGGRGFSPEGRAFAAHWSSERRSREDALREARSARDVEAAYVLAVELAAIERARGAPVRAQVLAFDDALRGLVLTEAQARALAEARERIASVP